MGKKTPGRSRFAIPLLLVCFLAGLGLLASRARHHEEPAEALPPMVSAPAVRTWKAAALKVEEDRGEPVGREARVRVPEELRHYGDRRRFLAIQVAASQEQDYDLPHDYAELAQMIRREQLVEMPPLGEGYILYGVGGSATDEPFSHYDRASGANIPLYDGWGDFQDSDQQRAAEVARLRAQVAGYKAALRKTSRKQPKRRRALQAHIRGGERAVALLERRRRLLASFYENFDKRRLVVSEYRLLADMAADFGGRSYDLDDPLQRRRLKGRLLSFLRPEAREVLLEIAEDYWGAFRRPLPVTSLVRTLGYQQALGRSNRNATQIESPPHASGLALDLYHGRMAAGEQEHLMGVIARLEAAGRAEALRENNDHIHVFVLPDGRPDETLIARSAAQVRPVKVAKVEARTSKRRPAASRAPARRPSVPARGVSKPAPRPR